MTDIPESPRHPFATVLDGIGAHPPIAEQLSDILPHLEAQALAANSVVRDTILLAERQASAGLAGSGTYRCLADQLRSSLPYVKAQADAAASIVRETLFRAECQTAASVAAFAVAHPPVADQLFNLPVLRAQADTASATAALFTGIGIQLTQARAMREIGWIPHPALPLEEFAGSETDPEALSRLATEYVQINSEAIYSKLLGRFAEYSLQNETADLCKDAIQAHRLRLFSLIVPAIFSEIEYCARDALGFGASTTGKRVIDNFIKAVLGLPISRFHLSQLETLILMQDFMFGSTIRLTLGNVAIPHRHGSQHGIIRYRDSQTGLNAIFLLDFVLRAREVMKGTSNTNSGVNHQLVNH